MSSDDYPIGFKKPPKEHQFAKGTSGNPRGRPKGSRKITAIFADIANERVTVKQGNRSLTMTRTELVMRQMSNAASKGDRHSRRDYLYYAALQEAESEQLGQSHKPHERDEAVFAGILDRLKKAGMLPKLAQDEDVNDTAGVRPVDEERQSSLDESPREGHEQAI